VCINVIVSSVLALLVGTQTLCTNNEDLGHFKHLLRKSKITLRGKNNSLSPAPRPCFCEPRPSNPRHIHEKQQNFLIIATRSIVF
jgi:hypothetical protein